MVIPTRSINKTEGLMTQPLKLMSMMAHSSERVFSRRSFAVAATNRWYLGTVSRRPGSHPYA